MSTTASSSDKTGTIPGGSNDERLAPSQTAVSASVVPTNPDDEVLNDRLFVLHLLLLIYFAYPQQAMSTTTSPGISVPVTPATDEETNLPTVTVASDLLASSSFKLHSAPTGSHQLQVKYSYCLNARYNSTIHYHHLLGFLFMSAIQIYLGRATSC